ncbi:MAG: AAA family ATPase [Rhodothermaceae bacterium]|nr:AAA family ATPase [Rhodothermaceae bacterium]MYG69583.1 AAA family ATPase [Rhodothermaceae bacterium]
MTKIDRISLSNVRCFEAEHSVALPRITVVIGENSSGKTTLLGCYSAFARLVANQNAMEYNPFNIAPFRMGAFENIARVGHKKFSLGGSANGIEFLFQFCKNKRGLFEEQVKIKPIGLEELTITREDSTRELRMSTPSFEILVSADNIIYGQISQWLAFAVRHGDFPYREEVGQVRENGSAPPDKSPKTELNDYLKNLSNKLPWSPIILESISPYLEPQQRQYGWNTALPIEPRESEELSEIGRKLSLFDQIRIRSTGDSSFELEVGFNNHFFNVSDVGLGIHAILPALRAMRKEGPNKTILLQQPEAHLHPMAQAQLAELIAHSPHQFIVESHSDFIINRLSICVRKEILDFEDVGILWLEKTGTAATIHELGFDENGNLLGAPAKYREFFNKETDDYLGIEPHVYADDN